MTGGPCVGGGEKAGGNVSGALPAAKEEYANVMTKASTCNNSTKRFILFAAFLRCQRISFRLSSIPESLPENRDSTVLLSFTFDYRCLYTKLNRGAATVKAFTGFSSRRPVFSLQNEPIRIKSH
jgi:hypothetical protein